MILASLVIFCCTALPSDAPKGVSEATTTTSSNVAAGVSANRPHPLPDAPRPKTGDGTDADTVTPAAAELILPKSQPIAYVPVKPGVRGSYESMRQRKIWLGLMVAGHGAAAFDAYSTRQAVSGGFGTESDPMLRPFAHSNAIYAATQVTPLIMDYVGHKMVTSEHGWMRRMWWVPQVAGASMSLSAGIHNTSLVK